jgi:predicted deacylase
MKAAWAGLLAAALVAPAIAGVADAQGSTTAATGPVVDVRTSTTSAVETTATRAKRRPAVISSRIIGRSVRDRPIRAFELGERSARRTVVALGAMHGNEHAGTVILKDLRDGRPIRNAHLWVIPVDNPDGAVRDRRHNMHGVDLNRNFPKKWKALTGWYYSGPRPASEPETRRLMRFLDRIDPDFVISIHQPLNGVDVYDTKAPRFARRLAEEMRLPLKDFDCGGVCHGTLTQWFNAHHKGAAVTVEFGENPGWRKLHNRAPRGLVRALGGRFG